MDNLGDLPPRTSHPLPLPSFASIECIVYEPPRASFMHNELFHDDPQPHEPQPQQPQSFFPTYLEIDESTWIDPPQTQEKINDQLDGHYAFSNMVDSHLQEAMNL